jgi:hypothetical protein
MARQQKKLPARRPSATDESLLIRSAESLGRVIGTLQRQLDAARRLVGPATADRGENGHAAARQRPGVRKERRPGVPVPVDSAKPATKTKSAAKSKTANAGKRPAKRRPTTNR